MSHGSELSLVRFVLLYSQVFDPAEPEVENNQISVLDQRFVGEETHFPAVKGGKSASLFSLLRFLSEVYLIKV